MEQKQKIRRSVTRVWQKPYVQQVLAQLRRSGYTVNKTSFGYEVSTEGVIVMRALNGAHNYIVSYSYGLFQEEAAVLEGVSSNG